MDSIGYMDSLRVWQEKKKVRNDEGGTCLLICAWSAGGGLEINGHAGGARHGTIGALHAAHPYPSRHTRYMTWYDKSQIPGHKGVFESMST